MSEPPDPRDRERSRRRFLMETAGALSAVAVTAGTARSQPTSPWDDGAASRTLRAVAEVALPAGALGSRGLVDAVARFERWRDGFRPVAELDHPYLSNDEILYGPPDPRPAWRAQLEALDLECRERHERAYAELDLPAREALLRRHLRRHDAGSRDGLPSPIEASHVALALMAWFYATPAANDLCHGRAIRRHSCRGLPSAVDEPAPLDGRDPFAEG